MSEPYDNPLWDFSNGVKKEEIRLFTKNSGLPKLLRWSHALFSNQKLIFTTSIATLIDLSCM